jgi:hypothetical protein
MVFLKEAGWLLNEFLVVIHGVDKVMILYPDL